MKEIISAISKNEIVGETKKTTLAILHTYKRMLEGSLPAFRKILGKGDSFISLQMDHFASVQDWLQVLE